jgi:putative hemolysin
MTADQIHNPFRLGLSHQVDKPLLRRILQTLETPIEKITYLDYLARAYEEALGDASSFTSFVDLALNKLSISFSLSDDSLERIPKSGPVVLVANHPFGGIEGLLLIHLLQKVRPDSKILANFLLGRIRELKDHFIFVDPFGSTSSTRKNMQPLRDAIEYLDDGGLIATFPSGTVSHFQWKLRQISDPAWNKNIARIIRRSQASVIPLYFEGYNSPLFQCAGLIHPLLRTALLPRELANKANKKLPIKIGSVIPWDRLKEFQSDDEVIGYLRLRTYILGSSEVDIKALKKKNKKRTATASRKLEPVVPAVDPALMSREVNALPFEQILLENGDYQVVYAKANQIPFSLREIGRLREITFRNVSEGTGKGIDLDGFDNYYTHLFIWNQAKCEIAGAYRLASVGEVLDQFGLSGLYTSTLFAYKHKLLEQLCPALELGRSFIRPEYQRHYSSLHLLWRGIGTYVHQNPDFKILFGTVSISNEYNSVSRMLIASFLRGNNYLPEFARLIKARNPHRSFPLRGIDSQTASVVVKDLRDVNELLSEIEAKHHSIPVLLKQYLRLGGKLLGFNIDKNFGDVLDGLIYVDLSETDQKILEKYLGKEETVEFLKYHGKL